MSRSFGKESGYLYNKETKYVVIAGVLLILVLGTNFILAKYSIDSNPVRNLGLLFGFFIIALVLDKIRKLEKRAGQYYRGRMGENKVSDEIKKLPDNYCLLPDIKFPGLWGNIDQVVIGPTGVYSIDTKSHAGRVTYDRGQLKLNGRDFEKDLLGQAYREASQLETFLNIRVAPEKINVVPMLVFSNPGASMKFGKKPMSGVYIMNKVWLNHFILQRKQILTLPQYVKIQKILQEYVNV